MTKLNTEPKRKIDRKIVAAIVALGAALLGMFSGIELNDKTQGVIIDSACDVAGGCE